MTETKRFYAVTEVANLLGLSVSRINTLIHQGKLRRVLLNSRRVIPAEAVDEYKSENALPEGKFEKITDGDVILYSVEGVCKVLSVGTTTVYRMIAEGKLKPKKIGTRSLFERSEVLRFVSGLPEE